MASALNTLINSQNMMTSSHKAAHIVDEMVKMGVDPKVLLKNTGLSAQTIFDENGQLSFSQSIALIKNAIDLSGVDGLGLKIGACENTSSYGLMGYAMSCAPTMALAAEVAIKYQKASPSLVDMSLQYENDLSFLLLATRIPMGQELAFMVEEVFSAINRSFYYLTGQHLTPQSVHFSYREPSYSQLYKDTFGCPVYFNASHNKIVYRSRDLEACTLQGNVVAQKMANTLCEQYMAKHQCEDDVVKQVHSALILSPGQFPNEEKVALQLGIQSRHLRRKLKNNNTSFQKIFDGAREQLATEYLQHSSMGLEDIADLVGFSDASNFRRAFKRWTGRVPSEYRKEIKLN